MPVKYPDFAEAVKIYLKLGDLKVKMGKSDMKSAFRNLGLKVSNFKLLVLKAVSPFDN